MFTTTTCTGQRAQVWVDGDPTPLVGVRLWAPGQPDDDNPGFGRIELPSEPEPRLPVGVPDPGPADRASVQAFLTNLAWRARLNQLPPGPQLCTRPIDLTPTPTPGTGDGASFAARGAAAGGGGVGDDAARIWANTLVDSLQARQRLINHLHAAQLADIADLSRDYPALYEQLPGEVGMALRIHETTATHLIDLGRRLTTELTHTWHALHTGTISLETATAVHHTTLTSPTDVATTVETRVLTRAPDMTPRAVRRRCRELVARIDPDRVRQRHTAAAADRCISRRLGDDGMAALTMWAPAHHVATVWQALSLMSDAARTPGDPRDAGNRRCDALTDLCHGILVHGTIPGQPPCTHTSDHSAHAAPAKTGDNAEQGDHAGTGEPGAATSPGAAATGSAPTGPTATSPTGSTGSTGPAPTIRATRRPAALINVTVPIQVLFGTDTACDIAGFGTITADQARDLITRDATLRRIVTDPLSGTILDVGRRHYRPPTAIADHVRIRDVTCTAPGCDNPADHNDIDHTTPFKPGQPTGGTTTTTNLNPPCRHHHRAKDGGGCTLTLTTNGYQWTTPLGRTYHRVPPTLYEPGDNDAPHTIATKLPDRIPTWATPHQQPNGTVTTTPTTPPTTDNDSDDPPPF